MVAYMSGILTLTVLVLLSVNAPDMERVSVETLVRINAPAPLATVRDARSKLESRIDVNPEGLENWTDCEKLLDGVLDQLLESDQSMLEPPPPVHIACACRPPTPTKASAEAPMMKRKFMPDSFLQMDGSYK
jgi:hypothetical protein